MALITSKSTKKNIVTEDITVVGIIPLQASQCPINKETNEPIKKSLLKLVDGTTLGVLDNQIKNAPLAFPKGGVNCVLSYENKEILVDEIVAGKATGKQVKREVSNVSNASFSSVLRATIELAGQTGTSVSVAGMF